MLRSFFLAMLGCSIFCNGFGLFGFFGEEGCCGFFWGVVFGFGLFFFT